mgnify:CR=1 FL=1
MTDRLSLEELVKELPPDCQTEVRDFAEFLLIRHVAPKGKKMRQNWAGALKEHESYTSVDLQHQASSWRSK